MTPVSNKTLQIGMVGHPALLRYNILQFRQLQAEWQDAMSIQISVLPIYHPMQIALLDGLLITGWHYPSLYRRVYPLQQSILHRQEQLSLWGITSGAALMGRNGLLPVLDCTIVNRPREQIHTAILELPSCSEKRFIGYFIPDINFSAPAPNIGVLCRNQRYGTIAIRQGNHLASSFAAELTPACYLYQYWLHMVAGLKEWQI